MDPIVRQGVYGPRTASEDWCEPNYVYTPYIAEFWNVMSSIPIFLSGAFGLYMALRFGYRRRFIAPAILMMFVGLGSIAFHGTLLHWGQALDELSMIYAMASFFFFSVESDDRRVHWKWLAPALLIYCVAFTISYLSMREYFVFFLLSFIAGSLFCCYRAWALYQRTTDPALRKLFWAGQSLWIGAFLFFWLPDKLLCHHVQAYNFHSIFHLLSALAPWWLCAHSCWGFYMAAYARRTGNVVDSSGKVIPVPLTLLKHIASLDALALTVEGRGEAAAVVPPATTTSRASGSNKGAAAQPEGKASAGAPAASHQDESDTVLEVPLLRWMPLSPWPYVELQRKHKATA